MKTKLPIAYFLFLGTILALGVGWAVDRWESTLVIQSLQVERPIVEGTVAYHRFFDSAFAPLDDAARRVTQVDL